MKNFIYVAMISFVVFATGGCGNKENNQTETAKQQTSTATNQKQADQKANPKACYFQKLADFQASNDKNTPVTNDMMEEWQDECKYNPDLENAESESASFDDDGKNNTVVASTTTSTATPARTKSGVKLDMKQTPSTWGNHTFYTTVLVVTSVENEVNLESMSVNRGNCKVKPQYVFRKNRKPNESLTQQFTWPHKLGFGESHDFVIADCKEIIEVQITHDGTTFKWNISN